MRDPQLELPFAFREHDLPFEPEPAFDAAGDRPEAAFAPRWDEAHREPQSPPLPPREVIVEQAQRLAGRLSDVLRRRVRLSVTDNRSTMVSFRRWPDYLSVRVHHMFLSAPDPVVAALADYAGLGRRGAGAVIDEFIRRNGVAIRPGGGSRPPPPLVSKGRTWDLQEVFDRVNVAHFGGAIRARIGWGRGGPMRRRRRTIRMGVYDHQSRTIRIHPALDRPEVPAHFLEFIVFHEMLHQAVPAVDTRGRKLHHSRQFRERERAFPGYARAIAWERANLGLLLGRRA